RVTFSSWVSSSGFTCSTTVIKYDFPILFLIGSFSYETSILFFKQLLFAMGDFEKNTRTHHIHVVEWNSVAWNNYINFRDYLNTF
ncbi:GrpB family protein, partial [Clostridioides difficile]